ncbi:hypothetical protein KAI87_09680, partial [Myxococcota bacterium]|nr:hypothetical protein [Myxococcota bacterium]
MAIKKSVHIRNLPPVHPGLEQRIRDAEEAEIQGRSPKKLEQIQKITRPSLHVSAAERASQARAIGLVDPAYRAFSDGLAVLAKQIPFRPGEDLDQIWDKLSESDKVRAGATERFRLEIDAAIRLATREWKIPHQIAGRLDARNLKRSLENIEAEIAALAYLLAPDSQELLKTVIDDTRSLIDTSLKHQAIKGVDGATMHTILRDLAHKMVYQELVSRRRGMGDRGIRRIAANIELAETLYKKLKRLPDFSLRERLWMRIVHIHQDLGHTAYAARASFRGGRMHRAYGVRIFTDEINRYRKIFPHQELRRAREAVATHAADVFPFADDRNLALIRAVDHLAPFAPHRVFKHLENIEGAS